MKSLLFFVKDNRDGGRGKKKKQRLALPPLQPFFSRIEKKATEESRAKTHTHSQPHTIGAFTFSLFIDCFFSSFFATIPIHRARPTEHTFITPRAPHPPLTTRARPSAGFEQEDGDLAQVEVDEMLRLVRDVGAKVAPDDAVPRGRVPPIELLLDVHGHILLDAVLRQSRGRALDGFLLHLVRHVAALDGVLPQFGAHDCKKEVWIGRRRMFRVDEWH